MTADNMRSSILRFRNGETLRTADQVEIDVAQQKVRVGGDEPSEADLDELKAVFFMIGEGSRSVPERGSLISIEFSDGEVIRGIAPEYNPTLPGFYLYPTENDRVERVFIVASAIVSIDVERL